MQNGPSGPFSTTAAQPSEPHEKSARGETDQRGGSSQVVCRVPEIVPYSRSRSNDRLSLRSRSRCLASESFASPAE